MPSIAANFDISTTATKKTFVDNDYVKVAEIENIYNKVKAIVDARAMNIVADVKYGDYEFNGSISLDLSDLNDPKLRIYNAYFNEYKVDITYIGNTLYAKINELKVYLAVDLDNIQDVLDKVKDTPFEFVANNIVLRSMSKAYYSVTNIGHFGLGSECYTHFTSPIRRYPDLIVHRSLKKLLSNQKPINTDFVKKAAKTSGAEALTAGIHIKPLPLTLSLTKAKTR